MEFLGYEFKASFLVLQSSGIRHDFGHANLTLGLIRGVLQDCGRRQALVGNIGTHPVKHRSGVGGGIDAIDIESRERLGVFENRLKLGLEDGHLFIAELKAGEIGNITDVDVAVRHA